MTDIDIHSLRQLRAADPYRSLALLFETPDNQALLLPVLEFYNEIARIQDIQGDKAAHQFRYQWWLDTVANMAGGGLVPSYPLAQSLHHLFALKRITAPHLNNIIMPRLHEADNVFYNVSHLAQYSQKLHAPLLLACADIINSPDDKNNIEKLAIIFAAIGYTSRGMSSPEILEQLISDEQNFLKNTKFKTTFFEVLRIITLIRVKSFKNKGVKALLAPVRFLELRVWWCYQLNRF